MSSAQLCDAFVRISYSVYRWLRRARKVSNPSKNKRGSNLGMQFHETTITDYVVLRLLEECYPLVNVFTFSPAVEAQTGADMELWLKGVSNKWLGLRIQCKILGPDNKFKHLHYKNKRGSYQVDNLIQASKKVNGCLPLYLLYADCLTPRLCSMIRPCFECFRRWRSYCYYPPIGNWFISAYQVKRMRPENDIHKLMCNVFPWQCIFCCHYWPAASTDIVLVWQFLSNIVFRSEDEIRQVEPVEAPPEYVRLALEGQLSEAPEQFNKLIEGREMSHLIILQLTEG